MRKKDLKKVLNNVMELLNQYEINFSSQEEGYYDIKLPEGEYEEFSKKLDEIKNVNFVVESLRWDEGLKNVTVYIRKN